MSELETWQRCLWALRLEVNKDIADDVSKHVTKKIETLNTQLATVEAEQKRLRELLREAYPYLPYAVSLAEELATMFPDLARPQDK